MSVKEVKFDRKDEVMNVIITHPNGSATKIECDFFGRVEGLDTFIAFWRPSSDTPSLLLPDRLINGIEILEEDKVSDNSKGN